MPQNTDLILTLTAGLTAALALGFLTQRLRLSPLVGYLIAGIIVGPFTPGFVADSKIASQLAEIGVILLMFGVGLHFHLKDLLAVRRIAIPGAVVQIAVATLLGAVTARMFDWSWPASIVFGMAISVASTVVLTRVLADNRELHTPTGHVAVGWLIVEDLFTILVLVLMPALFTNTGGGSAWLTIGLAMLKLATLVAFTLIAGQKVIPWFLGFVARSGSRDLFTLAVLVLALGIAVGSAKFFGASMALGAFLAGMVVGQSDFSARAAADALPMRDAFAVLFFVSVGMLFDPWSVPEGWRLIAATLAIVLVGKPLAALVVVLALRRPLRSALTVAVALAQIGEFSFILSVLATGLKVLPPEATGALVVTSVISIAINPLLYRLVGPLAARFAARGASRRPAVLSEPEAPVSEIGASRAIVVGHGPIGRTLTRILRDNGLEVGVVEMNLETARKLRSEGIAVVYGDASRRDVLEKAGIEDADSLIVSASAEHTQAVVRLARDLNPRTRILARAAHLRECAALRKAGADAVFAGEGEIALAMTAYLMHELGATDEQVDRERRRVRDEIF